MTSAPRPPPGVLLPGVRRPSWPGAPRRSGLVTCAPRRNHGRHRPEHQSSQREGLEESPATPPRSGRVVIMWGIDIVGEDGKAIAVAPCRSRSDLEAKARRLMSCATFKELGVGTTSPSAKCRDRGGRAGVTWRELGPSSPRPAAPSRAMRGRAATESAPRKSSSEVPRPSALSQNGRWEPPSCREGRHERAQPVLLGAFRTSLTSRRPTS